MLFDRIVNLIRANGNDFLEKYGLSDEEYIKAVDEEYESIFGEADSTNFDTDNSSQDSYNQQAYTYNTAKEAQYYKVIGLPTGASYEQIKTAYKKLMKAYHPDRHQGNSQKQKWALEQSQKVNEAYTYFKKKFEK